jgi:flagellin-specific chaperone FliS
MLASRNPAEAYRRVDFDARVAGADPQGLVALCYEQVVAALGSAGFAHQSGDNRAKSKAITRALAAVTALQLGVSGEGGVVDALRQFYESARRSLIDNALNFDPDKIADIRHDFADIAAAVGLPDEKSP